MATVQTFVPKGTPQMGSNIDGMLGRYKAEIDGKQQFIETLLEKAQKDGRDLNPHELELSKRARDEITALHEQLDPMLETQRIAQDSATKLATITQLQTREAPQQQVEYRTAGEYIIDRWRAGLGHEEAVNRVRMYHRAAAHQTTPDNPGLLPEPIIGPVVNFVDEQRPFISALGPRQLPGGSWSRPKVTQHTAIAAQSAEKAELASQKMIIGKLPVTPATYGGYVNVSRQDADWTQPGIMDIIVGDLAGQYALVTENVVVDAAVAGSTAGPTLPTGAPTADDIAGAFWTAAGAVYNATKGQGRLFAAGPPQMLGMLGPLFAPINPQNAQSPGFTASGFGQGAVGTISGIPFYVTAGMADNTMLVLSSAAAEVYEDRVGSLQVVEPSVLGIQVAYAGYLAHLIIEATGIQKITKTP